MSPWQYSKGVILITATRLPTAACRHGGRHLRLRVPRPSVGDSSPTESPPLAPRSKRPARSVSVPTSFVLHPGAGRHITRFEWLRTRSGVLRLEADGEVSTASGKHAGVRPAEASRGPAKGTQLPLEAPCSNSQGRRRRGASPSKRRHRRWTPAGAGLPRESQILPQYGVTASHFVKGCRFSRYTGMISIRRGRRGPVVAPATRQWAGWRHPSTTSPAPRTTSSSRRGCSRGADPRPGRRELRRCVRAETMSPYLTAMSRWTRRAPRPQGLHVRSRGSP